jgi:putative FmdB family regulatory protein
MIYQFKCEKCNEVFEENLPMNDNNKPLSEPCPLCNKEGGVYRDFSSVSLSYDMLDVQTRARNAAGSDFGDLMKSIHKHAGRDSKIDI